ncbi:sugar phosphate isomerase/epimerase family protein [Dactylosporangium maewongense]
MTRTGLTCIEWGGDVHVPPGDPLRAEKVGADCRDRGIRVASYGSYFRPGRDSITQFAPVLEAAAALRAPRIRIWAGNTGSAQTAPDQRHAVIKVTRAAAAQAADAGVQLAFEFHGGTLTDTAESAVRLLEEVDHPAVGTYWQPPVGLDDPRALAGLRHVLPWVTAVHVFSWWPHTNRLPLAARSSLWLQVFALLQRSDHPYDALMEFVSDDDPAHVIADARTLARIVDATHDA